MAASSTNIKEAVQSSGRQRRRLGCVRSKNWRTFSRPHLNWDFLDGRHHQYVVSHAQQERQLLEDLLNCFLGFKGLFIRPTPLDDPNGERNFTISSRVFRKLRKLVEKILPSTCYYSEIIRYIKNNQTLEVGRVNHALSGYIENEMKDVIQTVSIMESRLIRGKLTLPKMYSTVNKFKKQLEIIHQITLCVGDNRGGQTLSALHKRIAIAIANQNDPSMFHMAAKAANEPFFESLDKWIYVGVVFDPFDEFMIIEKTQSQDPNDWDNKFDVDDNYVPSFLETVVKDILSAGKCLVAVRNSLSYVLEETPIARESISYDFFDESYLGSIKRAREFANDQLLQLLFERRDFLGRLRTAKAFFSLEYGDLFHNIISNCMEELEKPLSEVNRSFVESLVESSIEKSSIKSLPYWSEVSVYFEERSLHDQTLNLTDPLSNLGDSMSNKSQNEQLGICAFTLKTVTEWPDCLVMDEKLTEHYQMMFRHLFYVKLVHSKLVKTNFLTMTLNQSLIKQNALIFINSCLWYTRQDTIEEYWLEFSKVATETSTIEELRSLHEDFVYKCLTICMLMSSDLYTKLRKTLDVCLMFAENQSEALANPFYDAVVELISTAKEANLPEIGGLLDMLTPVYDDYDLDAISSSATVEYNSDEDN